MKGKMEGMEENIKFLEAQLEAEREGRDDEPLSPGVTRRSLREYSARDLADHLLGSTEAPERAVLKDAVQILADVLLDPKKAPPVAVKHAPPPAAAPTVVEKIVEVPVESGRRMEREPRAPKPAPEAPPPEEPGSPPRLLNARQPAPA